MRRFAVPLLGVLAAMPVARPTAADAPVSHPMGLAARKGASLGATGELWGTLAQTHTDERVLLDDASPAPARFATLLADRVTGSSHEMDPRLVELLRKLAKRYGKTGSPDGAAIRVELVSGFRSPKLNEMMRKKGHHVARHSQHSLGHAVDFRIVLPGAAKGVDPRELEQEIRKLGWNGGVGVYTLADDWFVHADVGPHRRWTG